MILTRKLVLVAYLVLPFSSCLVSVKAQSIEPNEVYSTGNIVLPTNNTSSWVNGVYQPTLTCWGWGDPGYCGPNAIVKPGNNIHFSFGTTDLYQIQAIANVLPNSGTGLVINGYNFGFTAKNGNGWDDGRVDRLNAYVTLYDSSSNVAFNRNYDLNYKFNWTTFNYSETFQTPYASKDLSNVRYGFVGGDNNYWAGPYGPEVTNITFSLKYTVDTCSVDPTSKPTCPGYAEALFKLLPQTTEKVQQSPVETTETQQSVTLAPTPHTSTQSISTSPQAAASSQQQKTNEQAQSTSSPSLKSILNLIGNERSRLGRLETSVSGAAVEQARQDAAKETAEAQSLAAVQHTQTVTSSQALAASLATQQIQNTTRTSIHSLQLNNQQTDRSLQGPQQSNQASTIDSNEVARQTSTVEDNAESKQLLSVTNPVALLASTLLPRLSSPSAQQDSSVKKSVEINDAASGKDISSIAKQPAGFDLYSIFTLKDPVFYRPYDVYRNQVNVDNVRALRQLSSDRLHNQMVEQQYRN
jgi:hypothetical protein